MPGLPSTFSVTQSAPSARQDMAKPTHWEVLYPQARMREYGAAMAVLAIGLATVGLRTRYVETFEPGAPRIPDLPCTSRALKEAQHIVFAMYDQAASRVSIQKQMREAATEADVLLAYSTVFHVYPEVRLWFSQVCFLRTARVSACNRELVAFIGRSSSTVQWSLLAAIHFPCIYGLKPPR